MQRKDTMLVTTTSRTLAIDTSWHRQCLFSLIKKVAMLVTMLRVLVRFALMQLLPMLWFRSQASLAARTMTGARSHRRNWGIRCRLRSLAMLGLLAGVLSLVLLVRLLLLALSVLRCCRMAG